MSIKPCPFCGYFTCEIQYDGNSYYVACPSCFSRGPSIASFDQRDIYNLHEAITQWNKRKPNEQKSNV